MLLTNGASPNLRGFKGELPLMIAIRLVRKDLVVLLLSYGADMNLINHEGLTSIDVATECSDLSAEGTHSNSFAICFCI